ncbi:O-antigen ligase family protein [Shewanella sp. 10N.286.51.B8]|uniref:O-antigen ligase family protein n=1 Tax=Shewanella sp. 10N.286.51.B8 TaxID=3229708 RepID=UPI003553591B
MTLSFYEYIYRTALFGFLFLMLNFSGDFTILKLIVLIVLFGFSLFEVFFRKGIFISKKFVGFLLLLLSLFSVSYLHGLSNGFEFSTSLLNSIILMPLICAVLSVVINKERLLFINNTLVVATAFLLLLSFFYVGSKVGLYQMPSFLVEMKTFGGVKIGEEQLEFRLTNQPSLIFLLPYISTMLFFDKSSNKKLLSILMFFGFIIVVLSGRRSLQVLFFFGIFLNVLLYILKYNVDLKFLFRLLFGSLVFVVILIIIFEIIGYITGLKSPLDTFLNTVLLAFDKNDASGAIRNYQAEVLLNYFNDSPIYGHGLNSHPVYIRNAIEKWSYEWVYLAFLAQNGFLITMVLLSCFVGIALKLLMNFKCSDRVENTIFGSIFSGYVCFVIASSSNPMVYFSWFWFLSIIVFNGCFKNRFRRPL